MLVLKTGSACSAGPAASPTTSPGAQHACTKKGAEGTMYPRRPHFFYKSLKQEQPLLCVEKLNLLGGEVFFLIAVTQKLDTEIEGDNTNDKEDPHTGNHRRQQVEDR